ncbi:MAG: hypothetical protein MZV65_44590 [Chromatiales bacterium]|nr:hypothetical protein [Chromatiales bacterium]
MTDIPSEIFVVDDDPDLLQLISHAAARRRATQSHAAESGEQALAAAGGVPAAVW